jgi:hypothetical protein
VLPDVALRPPGYMHLLLRLWSGRNVCESIEIRRPIILLVRPRERRITTHTNSGTNNNFVLTRCTQVALYRIPRALEYKLSDLPTQKLKLAHVCRVPRMVTWNPDPMIALGPSTRLLAL